MDFHILKAIFDQKNVFFRFKSAQRAHYIINTRCIPELYYMDAFKHKLQSVGFYSAAKLIKAPTQSVQYF